MSVSDFGELLYKRLPEIYREKDKELFRPYVLRDYLSILGASFDEFLTYTEDLRNLFDVDLQDEVFLNPSIKLLGASFPYSMTDSEKRGLIKILPTLYENKGNSRVFTYLAQLFFGTNATVSVLRGVFSDSYFVDNSYTLCDTFYTVGTNDRRILITVTFYENIDFDAALVKFLILAEQFRPVNTLFAFRFISIYDMDVTFNLASVTGVEDFGFTYWDNGSGLSSWNDDPPDSSVNEDGIVTLVQRKAIDESNIVFLDADNLPTSTVTNIVQITVTFAVGESNSPLREFVIWNNNATPTVVANKVHYKITKTSDFSFTRKLRLTYTLT